MATFSESQVRHLYVVKANKTGALSAVGDADFVALADGGILNYLGTNGQVRSDLIEKNKITYIKAVKGKAAVNREDTIKIDKAVAGQEYIVKIIIDNWGSGSIEDKQTIHGSYVAKASETASNIATGLKNDLEKVLSKYPENMFTLSVSTDTITVKANTRPFVLGKKSGEFLKYNIQALRIKDGTDEPLCATITTTKAANPGIGTGRQIADLEWFCMGERADQYRGVGYPHNFENSYVADTSKNYNIIEIGFYYSGDNEDVQKSQKQITIAVEEVVDTTTVTDAIITKMNTALGTSIAKLTAGAQS